MYICNADEIYNDVIYSYGCNAADESCYVECNV